MSIQSPGRPLALFQLVAITGILLSGGCFRTSQSTGLPSALNTDAQLLAAGASQRVTIQPLRSGFSQADVRTRSQRHAVVKIASGTRSDLLTAYRSELLNLIQQHGGTVRGSNDEINFQTLESFEITYAGHGVEGIIQVRTVPRADGSFDFWQFCYEGRY